jgi:hypothetical protein
VKRFAVQIGVATVTRVTKLVTRDTDKAKRTDGVDNQLHERHRSPLC